MIKHIDKYTGRVQENRQVFVPRLVVVPFLKGPILLCYIRASIALLGKAFQLYIAIHHRSTLKGGGWITLPTKYLAEWGINRAAKYRDLQALQGAGLIELRPVRRGHSIRVRLVGTL